MCTVHVHSLRLCWHGTETSANFVEDQGMRVQHQWWSVLVAAVLGGLVSTTLAGAAGEQFIPILSVREGP